jgi:hypothetical protein
MGTELFDRLVDNFYEFLQHFAIDYKTALQQTDSLTETAVCLANWNNQVGNGGVEQYIENDYLDSEGCFLLDICEDAVEQDNLPEDTKEFFEELCNIVYKTFDAEDCFHEDCLCSICGTDLPDWAQKPRELMFLKELDELTHQYYRMGDDIEEHFEAYLNLLKEQGDINGNGEVQSV